MTKPVTPQDMFDMWQKMVNPGAYPLQSLMFPVLDPRELEKKVAELQAVEHWLKASLGMLQLSIKSLEYQRAMLEGGAKAGAPMPGQGDDEAQMPNLAMWAWNAMADAARAATPPAPPRPAPKRRKKA